MNVSPAHFKPPPLPAADATREQRGRKEDHQPFGDVLAAALGSSIHAQVAAPCGPGASPAQCIVDAMPAACLPAATDDASLAIGEDAVRFDARPIVGPSFVPGETGDMTAPGGAQSLQLAPGSIDTSTSEPELNRLVALAAQRLEAVISKPVAWTAADSAPSLRPASNPKLTAVLAAEAPVAPRVERSTSPRGPAASAPAPERSKFETKPTISLALLADEVLVTVRGLDLGPDEEEALGDEMRRLISSSDFDGRTLRIVTSGRV